MSDPCKLFDGLTIGPTDPIEDRLRVNALKNCVPLNVTMELTQECNFRCGHCYNFDRTSHTRNPHHDRSLSLEKWKTIIDEVRSMGCFYICFTGGETLTVPFLDELIAYAKSKGASIRIKTNGSLLTESRAKRLKELGVDDMEFSLYGGVAETHDRFTGTYGHFEKVLAALEFAKKYHLNPVCNIILHKESIKEYAKMISLTKKRDIAHQSAFDLSTRYDGTKGSLDYRITIKDTEELLRSPEGESLLPKRNSTGNIQCSCARANCGIGFDGSVYPCIGAPVLAGSLRDQSFKDIWKKSPIFLRIRSLKLEDYKDCNDCGDREYCQRSSGLIYSNTGNYTGAEEQTCEMAALVRRMNEENINVD